MPWSVSNTRTRARMIGVLLLLSSLPLSGSSIRDWWYTATVDYTNLKTFYKANYTLDVRVEWDRVTIISFPKGGSLHSGVNNSGYVYSGGWLTFERNYYGDIIAAATRVTVFTSDGSMLVYNITIE